MSNLHSINVAERLYVLEEGNGYGCLGFDYAFELGCKLAIFAGTKAPHPQMVGTESGYAQYLDLLDAARAVVKLTGVRCGVELHPQLKGLEGKRVEVVDADGNTRRFWVGRSTGWLPVHLEIARSNSSGGPAVDSRPYKSVRIVRER